MRKNAFIAGTFWMISSYCYYVSVFGLEALKGSIYFNALFSAIADLIGNSLIDISSYVLYPVSIFKLNINYKL